MCNKSGIEFAQKNLKEEDIRSKSVIEVGSLDVNGSLRPIVEAFYPYSYIGVDICKGHGVDLICNAKDILERFGCEAFDTLISTELLEHIADWRQVVSNFKRILKPNGILLITTRSRGVEYHGYPFDFWRYEITDMKEIFSDFYIEAIEKDPLSPGVFIKARKPNVFRENDLSDYQLYSIIKGKPAKTITEKDINFFKIIGPFLPHMLPTTINRIICSVKKAIFLQDKNK